MEVRDRRQIRRLELTAVHHRDLVAYGDEALDDGPADEPRSAEDRHPHRQPSAR
jgi:hypothetical protein